MTTPTPRSTAPADVQCRQAVIDAMADLDQLDELPVADALARLEAAQQQLATALNPQAFAEVATEPSP